MVPPGWDEDEENDPFLEEEEESEFSSNYNPTFDEENEEDYYDDEFVDTPSEDEEVDELDALISEGEALIEEGEYQQALELFIEAAERFNDNPLAIFHVGQTYLMLFTDFAEVEAHWEDDDDLVTYKEEAENAFETSLSLDEEYYPSLNGLGALALLTGQTTQAIEYWKQSLEISEEQEDIQQALEEAKSSI